MSAEEWLEHEIKQTKFIGNKCFFLERNNSKEWLNHLRVAKRDKNLNVHIGSGYVFIGDPHTSDDMKQIFGDWICFK